MAKKKTSADFDADIQKFIAGAGADLPAPTPALIKEMGLRLRSLQTSYIRATNPTDKAVFKAEFDSLAKAERDAKVALGKAKLAAAKGATFVTHTNLFALTEMVLQYGPNDIPRRVPAVDAPHLKRCVMAGLLEEHGGSMRLTPEGRTRVADELVDKIAKSSSSQPRENTFIKDPQDRIRDLEAQRSKIAAHHNKLERVLSSLTR